MDNEEREELRRFLAEEVMGWVDRGTHWSKPSRSSTGIPGLSGYLVCELKEDWQPDIRIEQAMMVADKVDLLRGDEGGCKLWKRDDDTWVVGDENFHDFYGWESWFEGQGDTPAEAICRAVKEAWEGGDADVSAT